MDLIEEYIHEVQIPMQEEIEQTIINFLRKEGYEVSNNPSPQEVRELQKAFEREGKRLRMEVFSKWSGSFTITTLILPFFEPIDRIISRDNVYQMFGLSSQGYQI